MEIPPEIFAQLPEKVWQPYRIRTGLRQLRELRTGYREHRGRQVKYTDEDQIRVYIEIEARAQIVTRGNILKFLGHHGLRLAEHEQKPRRLHRLDRQRLRKRHSEGQREAITWRNVRCMGRPHPKWAEIQRRVEARMHELRSSPQELLILKIV